MRFMLRVEVADVTRRLGGGRRAAPGAESLPGEPLAWRDPWPGLVGDTAAYGPSTGTRAAAGPGASCSCRGPTSPRPSATGRSPAPGPREALRVAAWRPRLGFETDHRTIPHEVDWLRTAVHLHKGCYRGPGDDRPGAQPRPAAAPAGLPAPRRLGAHAARRRGDPCMLGGARAVGQLTSVARHHEDGPIALALVKRNTPLDAVLTVAGLTAAQTEIVTR